MTFSLINPTGWNIGDPLTADQVNEVQTDLVYAVDGRGGTYNNSSPVVFTGHMYSYIIKHSFDAINPNSNLENWQFKKDASYQGYVPGGNTSQQIIIFPLRFDAAMNFKATICWNTNLTGISSPTKHTVLATWKLEKISIPDGGITVLESGTFDSTPYDGSHITTTAAYAISPNLNTLQITVSSPLGGSGSGAAAPTYSTFAITSIGLFGTD